VILPLSVEALLMGPEIGDALPDLFTLGVYRCHGRYWARFDDSARRGWLDPKGPLRKPSFP
jgi:hypothetical protein